ncbi:MAG: hypothetical protein KF789_10240 [Bdellovibrionaceae bacterium]|nr:hypothetical protein [Pseudobdellovibrionaceae bacterium]
MKNHLLFQGLLLSGLFVMALSGGQAQAQTSENAAYARQVFEENGKTIYIVGPRAPHLYMISRDLYGTDARWKDLAKWNSLKEPYALESGRKLVIQVAPTQSDGQANQILIREWNKRGDVERSRQIALLQASSESELAEAEPLEEARPATAIIVQSEPVQVPAPPPVVVVAEKVVVTPPPVTAPVPTEPAPIPELPVPVAPTPQATPPPIVVMPPQAAPVRKTLPAVPRETKDSGFHSHWHWSVKALAAVTEVMNHDQSTNTRKNLSTHVDPGLEIETEWKFNPRTFLMAAISFETFEARAPHGTVEPEHMGLWRFQLGIGRNITSWLDLSLSAATEQMVVTETTGGVTELARAEIPQLVLGSRWLLAGGEGRTKVHGILNVFSLFRDKVFHHELKEGVGASVGVQVTHAGGLTYGLTGRAVEQNAENFKTQQTAGVLNIGWSW